MLVHKKVTKEYDTPSHLFPALLIFMGGNRNSLCSNSRLPKPPIKIALFGMAAGDKVMQVKVGD